MPNSSPNAVTAIGILWRFGRLPITTVFALYAILFGLIVLVGKATLAKLAMPRYKPRTLLVVLALGPMVLGGCDSRTDHTIKTVKRGADVVDEHAKEIEKAAESRINHQLPMPPNPSFKEVELPQEQVEGHTAGGGVSLRCFVAVVADGELCAYVAQRNSPKSGKPTWHISVSVGNTEEPKAGIVRWPTSDELRACMLLTGQGDQVKFKAFKGEMAYLVHLVEVEQ